MNILCEIVNDCNINEEGLRFLKLIFVLILMFISIWFDFVCIDIVWLLYLYLFILLFNRFEGSFVNIKGNKDKKEY